MEELVTRLWAWVSPDIVGGVRINEGFYMPCSERTAELLRTHAMEAMREMTCRAWWKWN